MFTYPSIFRCVTAALLVTCACASLSIAQDRVRYPLDRTRYPEEVESQDRMLAAEKISPKVLETEQGRKLVNELRFLRNSEAMLGPKHPLVEDVKKRIAETKRELVAFQEGGAETDSLDKRALSELTGEVSNMDAAELRQLVLRLIARISELETQVAELKQSVDK